MVISQRVIDFYVSKIGENKLTRKCKETMNSMYSEDVMFHRELQEKVRDMGYKWVRDRENMDNWKRNSHAIHTPSLNSANHAETYAQLTNRLDALLAEYCSLDSDETIELLNQQVEELNEDLRKKRRMLEELEKDKVPNTYEERRSGCTVM